VNPARPVGPPRSPWESGQAALLPLAPPRLSARLAQPKGRAIAPSQGAPGAAQAWARRLRGRGFSPSPSTAALEQRLGGSRPKFYLANLIKIEPIKTK